MSEFATLDDLTADVVSDHTADVELSNGLMVTVRGLTRHELLQSGKGTDDVAEIERRNLVACVLVPAGLTLAKALAWQKGSHPDDIGKVTALIRDLSHMSEGAGKSTVAEVRD